MTYLLSSAKDVGYQKNNQQKLKQKIDKNKNFMDTIYKYIDRYVCVCVCVGMIFFLLLVIDLILVEW